VLERVRADRPYRQLTLHRYRLRHDQGGAESVLDFDADHLRHLIRLGYRDAAEHDCAAEGCVLPYRTAATPRPRPAPGITELGTGDDLEQDIESDPQRIH
jgi:hypothetical protein